MNPKSNIEMKKVLLKILFIFFPIILFAQNNYYDVVVVGGTRHILEGFPLMDWGLPILRRGELLPVCSESL